MARAGNANGNGERERERGERGRLAPTAETSLATKLAWYASEAFGDATAIFRGKREDEGGAADASPAAEPKEDPIPWDEAVSRLRSDYDRVYFVTGQMDLGLYESDCEFADPFVSFRGLSRFKKNLDNLGRFMEDVQLVVDEFTADEESGKVETKVSQQPQATNATPLLHTRALSLPLPLSPSWTDR